MDEPRIWHLVNDDKTTSEISEELLRRRIRDGSLRRQTLVWTSGMEDWRSAIQVFEEDFALAGGHEPGATRPGLSGDKPKTITSTEASSVRGRLAKSVQPVPGRRSYIVRHWRGHLSLAVSYWVNGFLVAAIGGVAEFALGSIEITKAPQLIAGAYASVALFLIAAGVWQIVGIWRSAGRTIEGRRQQGKRSFWAGLARVAAALGFLSLVSNSVRYTLPFAWANLEIAFGGDTQPRHVLTVLNDGTEIKLSGGIDFGTAADLKVLLEANPGVRTIDLDSLGGRVAEAALLRDLIRDKRLATYTDAECASACTLAYMGGISRYLGPRGRLGFHRYSFPGFTPEEDAVANQDGQRELISSGVSPDFAAKAFATPSTGMWVPDQAALVSAGVVTKIVDGLSFSAAAGDGARISRASVEGQLDTIASFASLKRADPSAYRQAVENILAETRNGKKVLDVVAAANGPLFGSLARLRLTAGDDVQIRVAATTAAEARVLADEHPDLCLMMLDGSADAGISYVLFLPSEMRQRDVDLTAAVIEGGRFKPSFDVASEEEANAEFAKAWAAIQDDGIDISQVAKTPATAAGQKSACIAMAAFFERVAALPPRRAGSLMRFLAKAP